MAPPYVFTYSHLSPSIAFFAVFPPSVVLSAFEIFEVVLMAIGLSFEGYVEIGVAASGEPVEPFQDIEDVEEDESHLFHLRRVYPLMVDESRCQPCVGPAQQDAEDVEGGKSRDWQIFVSDDYHNLQW